MHSSLNVTTSSSKYMSLKYCCVSLSLMELSFHEDLIVLALFPGLLAFHLQFSIKNWMSGNKARPCITQCLYTNPLYSEYKSTIMNIVTMYITHLVRMDREAGLPVG